MVRMVTPEYANLGMELIINYNPAEEKTAEWHTVSKEKESFLAIAKQHEVPVGRLIEFNFPGSVKNGHINPDIVNWYLFHHRRFRCRDTTSDGANYMFRGGEKVAIPYLGQVQIGEPEIILSRNTNFKIRMLANLNASMVGAIDFSIFQIWDEKAQICSFYTYRATGVAAGPIPGAWLSATTAGDWTDLTVSRAMSVNQFTGPTRFTTGGAGPISWNYINFMDLRGAQTIPNPLPIRTGFTIGIGAGTSVGIMKLETVGTKDGLLPYKGD